MLAAEIELESAGWNEFRFVADVEVHERRWDFGNDVEAVGNAERVGDDVVEDMRKREVADARTGEGVEHDRDGGIGGEVKGKQRGDTSAETVASDRDGGVRGDAGVGAATIVQRLALPRHIAKSAQASAAPPPSPLAWRRPGC